MLAFLTIGIGNIKLKINVEVAQIQNVDHLLNFEQPNELNQLILKFLRDRHSD